MPVMTDLSSVKPTNDPPADPPRKVNWIPSRKAISGGIGGVVSYMLIVAASYAGYPIPAELQGMIPGAITWLIYYLVPSSEQDIVRNLDNKIVAMAVADPTSPVTQPKIAAEVRAANPGTTGLY